MALSRGSSNLLARTNGPLGLNEKAGAAIRLLTGRQGVRFLKGPSRTMKADKAMPRDPFIEFRVWTEAQGTNYIQISGPIASDMFTWLFPTQEAYVINWNRITKNQVFEAARMLHLVGAEELTICLRSISKEKSSTFYVRFNEI